MLNTRQVLAKTRSELKGKEGRKYWGCNQIGHLAKNCRNKGGRVEEKNKTTNKFEMLASRVMQYRVREVRRQEVVEQAVKCFWYGKGGHRKWECMEKKKTRTKEAIPR